MSDEQICDYTLLLDDFERGRAAKFMMAEDRNRYVAAHGQMRQILSLYVSKRAHELTIYQPKGEKPRLEGELLFFNLSHSGNYALVAVSKTGEVGIDIEYKRPQTNVLSLARSTFSSTEYQSICSVDEVTQRDYFFNCWTRKEAFIKAIGKGFSYDTKAFTVSVEADKPSQFLCFDRSDYDINQWHLLSFEPYPDTQAALAFAFELKVLHHFELGTQVLSGVGIPANVNTGLGEQRNHQPT